ncbi:hypothetical protein [Providencia rustigianii]|uniref:hypothetical protein n=1 Tax=Providencia rustigianii TaxID=158850 RepID=UPI0038B35809
MSNDSLKKLHKIKNLLEKLNDIHIDENIAHGHILLNKENYNFLYQQKEENLFSSVLQIEGRNDLNLELVDISKFNEKYFEKNFNVIIVIDLQNLRAKGISVYKDIDEAISLSPIAPEYFLLLSIENDKLVIYPNEQSNPRIFHYIQIGKIWETLVRSADDSDANSCTFLGLKKSLITLNYEISDLNYDLDGYTKFIKLMSTEEHSEEKRKILSNTIYYFTSNKEIKNRLKTIIEKFPTFVEKFEDNYHTFAVGFSFDKIRKEYEEKYRDYLSKVNSVLNESLTRALAIPASTVLTFSSIKSTGNDSLNQILINSGSFLVALFVLFTTYYTVKFQINFIKITKNEFFGLHNRLKTELNKIQMKEEDEKFQLFSDQCDLIKKLLRFILSISITNLIINICSFIFSYL